MAVEALSQKYISLAQVSSEDGGTNQRFRLRDIIFAKALVLQGDNAEHTIMLSLTSRLGAKASWNDFKISFLMDDMWSEHCHGTISVENFKNECK